jgi:hypothetical protein
MPAVALASKIVALKILIMEEVFYLSPPVQYPDNLKSIVSPLQAQFPVGP